MLLELCRGSVRWSIAHLQISQLCVSQCQPLQRASEHHHVVEISWICNPRHLRRRGGQMCRTLFYRQTTCCHFSYTPGGIPVQHCRWQYALCPSETRDFCGESMPHLLPWISPPVSQIWVTGLSPSLYISSVPCEWLVHLIVAAGSSGWIPAVEPQRTSRRVWFLDQSVCNTPVRPSTAHGPCCSLASWGLPFHSKGAALRWKTSFSFAVEACSWQGGSCFLCHDSPTILGGRRLSENPSAQADGWCSFAGRAIELHNVLGWHVIGQNTPAGSP